MASRLRVGMYIFNFLFDFNSRSYYQVSMAKVITVKLDQNGCGHGFNLGNLHLSRSHEDKNLGAQILRNKIRTINIYLYINHQLVARKRTPTVQAQDTKRMRPTQKLSHATTTRVPLQQGCRVVIRIFCIYGTKGLIDLCFLEKDN